MVKTESIFGEERSSYEKYKAKDEMLNLGFLIYLICCLLIFLVAVIFFPKELISLLALLGALIFGGLVNWVMLNPIDDYLLSV